MRGRRAGVLTALARALLATVSILSLAAAEAPTSVDLIDPTKPDAAEAFEAVDDRVMGGVSQSRVTRDADALVFSGVLSLEQGGGFASVRAGIGPRDLAGFAGVEVVVRGDGRRYKLDLRDDDRLDGVAHRVSFEARAGEALTLRFPFESFEPSFRGRPVPDAPPLDRRRIQQLGLLVSDRQAGAFRLEVLALRAYR